jgi:uncharacterized membrane protein YdjX (TVP38/TMEM64 family)
MKKMMHEHPVLFAVAAIIIIVALWGPIWGFIGWVIKILLGIVVLYFLIKWFKKQFPPKSNQA